MSADGTAPPTGNPPGGMVLPAPVDVDNPGNGPFIVGITWTFQIIALVAVAARLGARKNKEIRWGLDDYLMVAAVLMQLGIQGLLTDGYRHGTGKHDRSLTLDQFILILKYNYLSVPFGIMVGLLSRTSITVLLSRLFPPYKWFIFYLVSFTVLMWVSGIVNVLITYLQITPTEALWDLTIIDAKRWDKRIWLYSAYFYQTCCTVSDLTYALFPILFIWKLNMPIRQRVSLILVMCGSIVSMSMSIVKTISMGQVANVAPGMPDVQYKASPQIVYGFVEQCLVIIIGCIPVLRTILKIDFTKLSITRRLYMYRSKQSASDQGSKDYNDLGTDTHKLSHLHASEGASDRSSGGASDRRAGSNQQLVDSPYSGQITRTDSYTVTYNPKESESQQTV
ncbi:hypothetical protein QQS21_007177 [Conoideocrella luteorostrata]|uniref:Rhodopsin domain-containing protein n=1 Tax=Conoideocrella luteorostrata TaxID=1105319 RepID=A0AAJ0FSP5_9HYPO|nr:hypothetical protein QQS21_007177 [Conoideocrella luteorostrata]